MTTLLQKIDAPADVRALNAEALEQLAAEIRSTMIDTVSRTGGHLAPSLGTVELTLALCRVFNFPHDKVIWDVGHQAYAWKLLTGRRDVFHTLRQHGGIRPFPAPAESPYDTAVGGHAGVALSVALGHAAARDLHSGSEHIIAVVGDASLTNGVSLEALNAIRHTTKRLILVINDNGMSISRNVGAFARVFARRLAALRYNRIRAAAEATGHALRLGWLREGYHRFKTALKPLLLRNRSAIFEDLGIRYLGPIDGHDIEALCEALSSAAESNVPIALHISTTKGKGYPPAERFPSKWHGVAPWAPAATDTTAAEQPAAPVGQSWSDAFGDILCDLAERDDSIVAVTAAMRDGTGLKSFFHRFPSRAYDVGICEEHAVAFAAGLAAAGKRPFVALYSTFAQRAVDCMMHDVCLPQLPVTLCLDRAGVVGADGPTHHGLYDTAMLRALPHLTLRAPCDIAGLRAAMETALREGKPCAIRYPRGTAPEGIPVVEQLPPGEGAVILAAGRAAQWLAPAAETLGLPLLAVDTLRPLPPYLTPEVSRPLIVAEDASALGGFGSAVAQTVKAPVLCIGWPDDIIAQGTEAELRADYGLDDAALTRRISAWLEDINHHA